MTAADSGWGSPPWTPLPERGLVDPPERCDVAVVGGGFAGLACAQALARAGREVVVFEADRLGAGASGRSGGLVLEDTAAGPLPGVSDCIDALERVVRDEDIACRLRLPGCREVLHGAPGTAPGDGDWRDEGRALFASEHVDGGTLDPLGLVAGLAGSLRADEGSICERSPVLAIEPGSELVLIVGRGGATTEVVARHVFVALGAFLPGLLPAPTDFGAALTLAVCTEPVDLGALGLAKGEGFYTEDQPYLWGRGLPDGRAIFGAGLAASPPTDPRAAQLGQPAVREIFERLERRVRGLHPALARAGITHRWGGPVCWRANRHPLVYAHPDLPGLFVAGAFAGHGVALSVRIGRLVADAILDRAELPVWGRPAPL